MKLSRFRVTLTFVKKEDGDLAPEAHPRDWDWLGLIGEEAIDLEHVVVRELGQVNRCPECNRKFR